MFFLWFFFKATGAITAHQAFGMNTVEVPLLGLSLFDASLFAHQKKPWGIQKVWGIGAAYGHTIDYHRLFWQAETQVAFGAFSHKEKYTASVLLVGAGIRYYFYDETIRPFIDIKLHYMQFLGPSRKYLALQTDWPLWLGLMPTLGISWLFKEEMALSWSVSLGFYAHISEPFRHIFDTKLSYVIYF